MTRNQFLHAIDVQRNKRLYITRASSSGIIRRVSALKTLGGRGRKRAQWTEQLHEFMCEEVTRFRALGIKINRELLRQMALGIVQSSDFDIDAAEIQAQSGKALSAAISPRWIASFCERHRIVMRSATGNKTLSINETLKNHQFVAYFLGKMKRAYEAGLDESTVENYDETYLLVDSDNGKVLDFQGKERVTYSEVSSGRDGFTVCMRITGGIASRIETPLIIFPNQSANYPILGLPDNIEGVCYRTSRKGWLTQALFPEYFKETRVIESLSGGRQRTLYMDSVRVHNETVQLSQSLLLVNTIIKRYRANCTTLVQPLDQMVLRVFKAELRARWENKRAELVLSENFTSTGRVANPGKAYFLQLVRDVVSDLNTMTYDGISIS